MPMHAYQYRFAGTLDIPANHGNVASIIYIAAIRDDAEVTMLSSENRFAYTMDITFVGHAVPNQLRHREHLHAMTPAKLDQIRYSSHGPVFLHDFANHARRYHACHAG